MIYIDRPTSYTDYYELTMAQGYFLEQKKLIRASFDYFFRKNPFNGGYVIYAGLSELIETLRNLSFESDELDYLKSEGFRDEFLDYLSGFQFTGTIYSAREGEVVFPNVPVLRIEGNLIEAQIIETLLLNILNFQ
ncbi:MAG: nicotinate phosphoribosyltransferase, partial [Balneolaceae bacterium]